VKHKIPVILFSALFFFFKSFSQTILPPDLQCVKSDQVNGNIILYWTNPPVNPCGSFIQYTIYGSSSGIGGPYNPIAVTNQLATTYTYVNALATSSNWYFYMEASYNCPGATVLQSDTVNNQNPLTPQIVNVTVTQNGKAVFNWLPSASPQTAFYIIYYFLPNGNAVPIDTVYGRFNTTYTDVSGDPTHQSLIYTISAADSCGTISAFNTSPHNTVFMTAGITACQRQVNMAWNHYINWPQGVKQYQIWVSRNDSAFALAGTTDTASLVYSFTNFNDGDSLCLFIRAISAADSNIVSNSNLVCMRASIIQPPSYINITNLTVNTSNQIDVTWTIDTLAQLIYYKILQSTNNVSYQSVQQYPSPYPLHLFDTYTDSVNVFPQNNPYYYEIQAIDSCQTPYTSPYGKTVCLKGELYDYYVASLTWNNFELQYATVLRYNMYRNAGNGYQYIRTFLPGINQYADSLQQFLYEKGTFCYRVEAVYYLELPSGYRDTLSSWSNEQCIIHRPIIYVPNAFAPHGVNNVFKPTIIYGAPQGYVMTIFNRWGGKIFESNDPAIGWDGTDHGKEAQQGGYGYLIQFNADDGVLVERKGMVLLVK
jgi:gliding motility-associated-like protein